MTCFVFSSSLLYVRVTDEEYRYRHLFLSRGSQEATVNWQHHCIIEGTLDIKFYANQTGCRYAKNTNSKQFVLSVVLDCKWLKKKIII